MGHRSLAFLAGAIFCFLTQGAFALGLGEITLKSTLNQPLRAEIELLEVRDLTPREILVNLATREDFESAGVDKVYFLTDLKFKVELNAENGPIVVVTSKKLVREPYLNFLVEAYWPSGRLLREYTLLMDLPVYGDEPAQPVQSATTTPAQPTRQAEPASTAKSAYNPRSSYQPSGSNVRAAASQSYEPSFSGDSYRVESGDTLWEIAKKVRPSRSVSVQQAMLAIQRANPEAFLNDNINLIRKGQILRIPQGNDMATFSARGAVAEVAKQNSMWRGGDSDPTDVGLVGTDSYEDSASSAQTREGRVKLSSPDESFGSSEGSTSGASTDSSVDALENDLAISQELLDKSNRENSDLRSKVESLEEQIATLERMIQVSNEDMRALELAAQRAREEREQVESEAQAAVDLGQSETESSDLYADDDLSTQDESSVDDGYESSLSDEEFVPQEDESQESVTEQAIQDEEVAQEQPAKPATPVVDRSRVVITPPQPEKGLVDLLMDYIIYIGAAVLLLVVGVVVYLRQKSSDEEEVDDFLDQVDFESNAEDGAELEPEEEALDEFDLGESQEDVETDNNDIEEFSLESEVAEADEEDLAPDSEPETEDVVAEADIYIAYGKYDQAEEMLLKALDREPNDEDIRLKLLEVYSSQDDAERFDPHYAKLKVFASQDAVDRAEQLRSNIADAPAFDEASFETSDVTKFARDEAEPESDELSLDLDGLSEEATDAGDGFELDLGDLESDELVSETSTEDVPTETGATGEFDLDLGDLESEAGLELDLGDLDSDGSLDLDIDLGDLDAGDEKAASDSLDLDSLGLELGGGDTSGE